MAARELEGNGVIDRPFFEALLRTVTLQQLEQQAPGGFVRSLAGDQALIQPVHEGIEIGRAHV